MIIYTVFVAVIVCGGLFLLIVSACKAIKGFSTFIKKQGWLCVIIAILISSLCYIFFPSRSLEDFFRLVIQIVLLGIFVAILILYARQKKFLIDAEDTDSKHDK